MSRLLNGERKKKIRALIDNAVEGFSVGQIIHFLRDGEAIANVCGGYADELVIEVVEDKFSYLSTYSNLSRKETK